MSKDIKKCCICGQTFNGYGNNPYPYAGDFCCDNCNVLVVMMRMKMLKQYISDESLEKSKQWFLTLKK